MGLKSGSRNSGLNDSQEADKGEDERELVGEEPESEDNTERNPSSESKSKADVETVPKSDRPTKQSLPYKLRREKVNAGREQVPFFLRREVIDAEGDLQDHLESELGENVYKSDYREAAMIVAQRKPELVAEVLREWGYDLNTV